MAWSYCSECGEGLTPPSVRQVAEGNQSCPKCDAENDPRMTLADVLEDFEERLAKLENPNADS